jgi:hypothetical protein
VLRAAAYETSESTIVIHSQRAVCVAGSQAVACRWPGSGLVTAGVRHGWQGPCSAAPACSTAGQVAARALAMGCQATGMPVAACLWYSRIVQCLSDTRHLVIWIRWPTSARLAAGVGQCLSGAWLGSLSGAWLGSLSGAWLGSLSGAWLGSPLQHACESQPRRCLCRPGMSLCGAAYKACCACFWVAVWQPAQRCCAREAAALRASHMSCC